MEKRYSALMSVYYNDRDDYLRVAIDSMLRQTIPPDQFVIVIDGMLKNETMRVIDEFRNDSRFTIVQLEENKGLANALNVGLGLCKNELIARMDADDISLPTRCEEEMKLFNMYDALAVCGCNIDEFYADESDIRTCRKVPSDYQAIRKFARLRQPFNHPTVMYKKSVILKVGGYPNLRRKEDFDLFSRLITAGEYVMNIDSSLYLYRANDGNYLRRKNKENLLAAFYVYRMHKKRGGCNFFEYLFMCSGELFFYFLPLGLMKKMSDKLLRK